MTNAEFLNVLVNLLSGIVGAVVAGIVSYFISRNKTNVEIDKLQAEIRKLNAETNQINAEATATNETKSDNPSALISNKLDSSSEQVIYDSAIRTKYPLFTGNNSQFWSSKEQKYIGPKGEGELILEESIDGTVLNIQRTNTDGRFEVMLKQFRYNDEDHDCIPKSDLIAGNRRIIIRCEAKVNMENVEHSLLFILRNKANKNWLKYQKENVTKFDKWQFIQADLEVSPSANLEFRIDDQEVSKAPSGVQIRKLLITEKIPKK